MSENTNNPFYILKTVKPKGEKPVAFTNSIKMTLEICCAYISNEALFVTSVDHLVVTSEVNFSNIFEIVIPRICNQVGFRTQMLQSNVSALTKSCTTIRWLLIQQSGTY